MGEALGSVESSKQLSGSQLRPRSGSEITSGISIWNLCFNTLLSPSRCTGRHTVTVCLKEAHPLQFVQALGRVRFQFLMWNLEVRLDRTDDAFKSNSRWARLHGEPYSTGGSI